MGSMVLMLVMGSLVLETNMTEILTRIEEQSKLVKNEVSYMLWWAAWRQWWAVWYKNKYDRNTHQEQSYLQKNEVAIIYLVMGSMVLELVLGGMVLETNMTLLARKN